MRKVVLAIAITTALVGCASSPVVVSSTFDIEAAKSALQPGSNTIKGSALIRQKGGGVVTCAGREVTLVPATAYADERMRHLYGNTTRGFNPAGLSARQGNFANEPPAFRSMVRTSMCDAQGAFKFADVADGEFYVVSVVTWQVNDYFPEGGALMQRVSVRGGGTEEIVLAP